MTLITVAIPFMHERLLDLELAVRSVFAQTVDDWRLVLIGDLPKTELAERVGEIRDPRVSVIIGEERMGLAFRLNQSIAMTRSPFYARMDADDVMFPTRLERQIEALSDGRRVDVVGTRAVVIDDHSRPEGLLTEASAVPEGANGFLRANAFTHPSVMGRTEWFQAHPYDASIARAEDKDLWLRTHGDSRFTKLSEPGIFYRVSYQFNRDKCVRTIADDFRVTRTGRHFGASTMAIGRMAASAGLKSIVYRIVPAALWPQMRSHRIETVDPESLSNWRSVINCIESTSVMGWNN